MSLFILDRHLAYVSEPFLKMSQQSEVVKNLDVNSIYNGLMGVPVQKWTQDTRSCIGVWVEWHIYHGVISVRRRY